MVLALLGNAGRRSIFLRRLSVFTPPKGGECGYGADLFSPNDVRGSQRCQNIGCWRQIAAFVGGDGENGGDNADSMKKSLRKLYGDNVANGNGSINSSGDSGGTAPSNNSSRMEKRKTRQIRRGARWRRKGDENLNSKAQGAALASTPESVFDGGNSKETEKNLFLKEEGDSSIIGRALQKLWGVKEEFAGASDTANGNESSGESNPAGKNGDNQSNFSSGDSLMAQSSYPYVVPIPLYQRPLLPGQQIPVLINDKRAAKVLHRLHQDGQEYVAAFLKKDRRKGTDRESKDHDSSKSPNGISQVLDFFIYSEQDSMSTGASDSNAKLGERIAASQELVNSLEEVGTLASFSQIIPIGANSVQIILQGHKRVRREGVAALPEGLRVHITTLRDDSIEKYKDDNEFRAVSRLVLNTIQEILRLNQLYRDLIALQNIQIEPNHHSRLADIGSGLTSASADDLQIVLETTDIKKRLMLSLELLKKEAEFNKVQADIVKRVQDKISEHNRRFYLEQQLKSIKKELGMEKDEKNALIHKFKDRMDADPPMRNRAPEEVLKAIDEELEKLSGLEPSSSELAVSRNYLEWLTKIPWNIFSEDSLEIKKAQQVLDEDHHGLEEVKERILEFIAVSQLRGTSYGKILLLSGPPGVGKTSIGKSIARALNRKFYRFSVGGLTDVAEIKGHRRTYVGSMPGKIVQCLKATQTSNPLVLIDEIDKLGRSYQGDPASALLELLDPEQNIAFEDHYMDVPIDLSRVIFVCTANIIDSIPDPLLDRMENIPLSGYIASEKVQIATKYLIPELMKKNGLRNDQFELTDDALQELIDNYCREAGVRNLEKHLDKIFRKLALKIVRAEDSKGEKIIVDKEELKNLVGKPAFASDKFYESTLSGVVMGLAWTASGGSTLYVETSVTETGDGKGGIKTTGQLGNIMKESTLIAHSVAKDQLRKIDKSNRFFLDSALHLHVPAGATPKDGPSAGIVMVTSMISRALDLPVGQDIAMTGEVSLTGRLLPIGGVREKTIAARRSGVTTLIFPEANQRDFEELPAHIRDGLTVHFLKWYDEVLPLAFPSLKQPEHVA